MTNEEWARDIYYNTVVASEKEFLEAIAKALDEAEQREREAISQWHDKEAAAYAADAYEGDPNERIRRLDWVEFHQHSAEVIRARQEKDDDPGRPLPPHTPEP